MDKEGLNEAEIFELIRRGRGWVAELTPTQAIRMLLEEQKQLNAIIREENRQKKEYVPLWLEGVADRGRWEGRACNCWACRCIRAHRIVDEV